MVEAGPGQGEHAADRRHLNDVPLALLAQDRQHRLGDPQGAEQVRFSLSPRLLLGHLLDHAEQPVAGVVDDHVERPEPVPPCGGGEYRLPFGDV